MSSAISALRTQSSSSAIRESLAGATIVQSDRLAGHRMRIVKRDGVGRGPEARWRIDQCIGTHGVLRKQKLRHRQEVDRGFRPALSKGAVPERVIAQCL